ncbi:hypothetical protein [Flavobacterium ranwuense]|nr:hypothetical protein [Flavobacterium ranwuense]
MHVYNNTIVKKGKLYIIDGKTKKDEEITIKVINYSERVVLEDIVFTKK